MDDIHRIYFECGLSDLEEFQLRDQQYLESMEVAYRLSLEQKEEEKPNKSEKLKPSEEEPKPSEEGPKTSEEKSEQLKKSEEELTSEKSEQLKASNMWKIYNGYRGSETDSLSRLTTHPDPYGVLFSPAPSALWTSPPQASTGFLKDITEMANCLNKIGKIYEVINVQHDDIFLTLADTHEIISVNQVIKEWRQLKSQLKSE